MTDEGVTDSSDEARPSSSRDLVFTLFTVLAVAASLLSTVVQIIGVSDLGGDLTGISVMFAVLPFSLPIAIVLCIIAGAGGWRWRRWALPAGVLMLLPFLILLVIFGLNAG